MNDSELLSAYLKDGSEEAFTALVNRHMKLVFSAALRQVGGDVHLAKDVVQQVFSTLARKAGSLRNHEALSGWLYTSTHYAAADVVRAEKRRQASERAAQLINEFPSAETSDIWDRIRPVLDRAMNELNARDRQALLLRYFEDRTFTEVGARLSLSENAARMRVARALDKMHALLARHGVTSTTAALAVILTEHSAAAAVPAGLAAEISGTALAGAAGAGALSLAAFMATAKMGAGVAGLLLIGFGLYQYRSAHLTDAAAMAARQEYNATQARLEKLEGRIHSAEQTRAAFKLAADTVRTGASPRLDAGGETTATRDPQADYQAFLAAFPEQRAAMVAICKAQASRDFSPFYRAAGLSSAQIAQFENFVAEAWMQSIVFIPNSIYPDSSRFPEEKLHALLGDEAYQHYQAYMRREGAHAFSLQIVTGLINSNAPPLSTDQADQLVQVILDHSPDYQNGGSFSTATMNWDAVMTQAQDILTPPQLKVAEGLFLNLQYQTALQALRAPGTSAISSPDPKTKTP